MRCGEIIAFPFWLIKLDEAYVLAYAFCLGVSIECYVCVWIVDGLWRIDVILFDLGIL